MKKVIIYGVKNLELRRRVENFLEDNYEIIGYSDGHYHWDIWDEKRFIRPEDLSSQEFDWILLCAGKDEVREEMKQDLNGMGIPPEKIINPVIFLSNIEFRASPDLIADIDAHYHGEKNLMFGLSYSALGVDKKALRYPFFDCSWLSLDLYYNFKIFRYLEQKQGFFTELQSVLWMFPYYYFDYDMSMSMNLYKIGRLLGLWRLDDWHNYRNTSEGWEYIENYRMFGRKICHFFHTPKQAFRRRDVYGEPDGSVQLDGIWVSNHEKTETENREIFVDFYLRLKEVGSPPVIVVPPFYLSALSAASKEQFAKKRERFYRILKELEPGTGEITVYDYVARFAERRELFFDWEHLNEAGAREFTELINRELL